MKQEKKIDKIYIQITAGRGPAECCWVVAQVLKVLINECKKLGFQIQEVDRQVGPQNGTLYSSLVEVSGLDVMDKLSFWKGTVQWIGKSPFRKFHKRKNWFIGVSFFEPGTRLELKLSDLEYQSFRASGPGGQHRNKVESAVRVIHKPSGLTATATESRSQHQNRQLAIKKLQEAFGKKDLVDQKRLVEDQWSEHLALERGNPVKVFQGRDFKEIT